MSAERVVVRRARAGDAAARAAVLRDAYTADTVDAFFYFFFHEVTLQGVVLSGAALFIFCGCGLPALSALPALAAAAVLLAARAAHAHAAHRQACRLRAERAGWVAERRGPPRPPGYVPGPVEIHIEEEGAALSGAGQIVGTVSVSECRDAGGLWLHALGVARAWRRRGAGCALEAAARAAAPRLRPAGSYAPPALHAVTSALQPAARALLHDAGWQCSGAYARPLLGAALALPLTRLQHDLDAPA